VGTNFLRSLSITKPWCHSWICRIYPNSEKNDVAGIPYSVPKLLAPAPIHDADLQLHCLVLVWSGAASARAASWHQSAASAPRHAERRPRLSVPRSGIDRSVDELVRWRYRPLDLRPPTLQCHDGERTIESSTVRCCCRLRLFTSGDLPSSVVVVV